MANILKRPMFRRGGSAAYNVGITSGLEPRKKYQGGTDPYEGTSLEMNVEDYPYDTEIDMQENVKYNIPSGDGIVSAMRGMSTDGKTSGQTMEAYADAVQKRLQPTDKEKVLDYLTAFGATGGESPTSLRTFGSAFGKAAANYQNIVAPKEQTAKKAGADVYASLLKGSLTKEKLYLYQQQAQDLAKVRNIPYNDALKIVLAKELGAKDKSEDIIEKNANAKVSAGIPYPEARAEAEIEYKITRDPEFSKKVGGRYKGSISLQRFMRDANGNYVLINPQQKSTYRVNDVFVDPYSKKLYYFDGKKLVPTQ
jgi:hypothetical protein